MTKCMSVYVDAGGLVCQLEPGHSGFHRDAGFAWDAKNEPFVFANPMVDFSEFVRDGHTDLAYRQEFYGGPHR